MLCYKHPETFTQIACLLLFSCQVVPDSLWPQGPRHTRPLCPSPSLTVCPSSCPLNRLCCIFCSWICDFCKPLPLFLLVAARTAGDWSQMKSVQSQAWGSCPAVDYDLDRGCRPQCLSVTSPSGLTYPMTRDTEAGFKEEHLKRKLERNCGDFSSLIVMHCRWCHFPFFRRKR